MSSAAPSPRPATGPRPTPSATSTAGGDRDRDEDGRPQNARPRDRTGRPLPRDTAVRDLVEEVEYETVEEALAWGVRRWNEGRFFEAHECLEDVWHWAEADESVFWQGVIQVAVTYVHHQRGNPDGVISTVGKALPKLRPAPDRHHGIDVAGLRTWLSAAAAIQRDDPGADLPPPSLGLHDEGAWVSRGSTATPLGRRGGPHPGTLT